MGLGGSIVFLGVVAGVLAVLAWISDRLERPRPSGTYPCIVEGCRTRIRRSGGRCKFHRRAIDRHRSGPQHRTIQTRWFGAMWSAPFDAGWFRLFGYGLRITDHRKSPPFFSERYQGKGAPKRVYVHLGPWCVAGLRPEPSAKSAPDTAREE